MKSEIRSSVGKGEVLKRSARKRVLFVECAAGFGGSSIVIRNLLKDLDRNRFEPIVLFYRHNQLVPELEKTGARVLVIDAWDGGKTAWRLPKKKALLRRGLAAVPPLKATVHFARFLSLFCRHELPVALRLRRIMARERVDLVHLNDEPVGNREAIVACYLARIPCVSHIHQFGYPNIFDRLISRRVDYAIYISRAMQQYWQERLPFRRHRVIHNGLDLSDFAAVQDAAAIRHELALGGGDFVVASVGRLTEWKGHRVLLRALALAREKIPNLACVVVGAPTSESEVQYESELLRLRESLGLASVVRFLGHRSDIGRILASTDVLAHTSTSPEPFGLVVIEGMAACLPVIATNAGGVPEIIDHGVNGLLVAPGDPQALAEALMAIASDRLFARRIGLAARSRVQERFTTARMAREVEAVYEAVLNYQLISVD